MPGFHQLPADELTALIAYLSAADAAGRGGGARGRGGVEPAPSFPPGPIVESGPAVERPGGGGGRRGAGPGAYPEGVQPYDQLGFDGYGLYPTIINPPYTTLTAYDLNRGVIRWQIPLGDDLDLAARGVTGTGSTQLLKGSVLPTATGLLFVNAADRKVHVYDAETGEEVTAFQLGATTSGSPTMFELNGRQYLLVAASAGGRGGGDGPATSGRAGLVAYALPAQ
jgi:quinoprotein glucose dehydrogenase